MVPCLSSLAPVVLMFLRPAASHTAQAGSEEDLELSWRPGTGQEVRVGWSGSLPVDYSSYSVRAPWDWGLAPRQFFRVCPDHTKTTSRERGPRAQGSPVPSQRLLLPSVGRSQPQGAQAHHLSGHNLFHPNPPQRGRTAHPTA